MNASSRNVRESHNAPAMYSGGLTYRAASQRDIGRGRNRRGEHIAAKNTANADTISFHGRRGRMAITNEKTRAGRLATKNQKVACSGITSSIAQLEDDTDYRLENTVWTG